MKVNPNIQSHLLSWYQEIAHFVSSKPFFLRWPRYLWEYQELSNMNLKELSENFSLLEQDIIVLDQVHASDVWVICEREHTQTNTTDAVITHLSWKLLLVLASDCVPILLFDRDTKVIGVIHAGWRGLAAWVIWNTIAAMKNTYRSKPENIICFVWPCISQNNYEVWGDVAEQFQCDFWEFLTQNMESVNTYFLDVRNIAAKQLHSAWILEHNIEISKYCTYQDSEKFNSYRRSTQTWEVYEGNNVLGILLK